MKDGLIKVLFAASEAAPFAKVGGLADVAGSLPAALADRFGVDARIILPNYSSVAGSGYELKRISESYTATIGKKSYTASIWEICDYKIPVYLVDCPELFHREGIYGPDPASGYRDNLERFTLFSQAVMRVAGGSGWSPDIIHCNDWQTGLIPAYLRMEREKHGSALQGAGCLLTIHNLAFQGDFPKSKIKVTGIDRKLFPWERIDFYGKLNLLKLGILSADRLNTVSSTYREETLAGGETGAGLEDELRVRGEDYSGILNGIEYGDWPPVNHRYVEVSEGGSLAEYKAANKRALFELCGFDLELLDAPVIGMVGRLTYQKGMDIMLEVLEELMERGFLMVALGSGEEKLRARLSEFEEKYRGRLKVDFSFNEPLAHLIYAGSDFFLMPSRYEPCGLTQMIAMRNGTAPVVSDRGGLKDSVSEFDPGAGSGTGFRFEELTPDGLLRVMDKALEVYGNAELWDKLRENAAAADFSWERSAERYLELYREISMGFGSR